MPKTFLTVHFWSLAIEEQFYLLWPGLLCLAGLGNTRRLLSWLTAPLAVALLFRTMDVTGYTLRVRQGLMPFFQGYSSFFHFDALAVGCAAAILLARHGSEVTAILSKYRNMVSLAGAALILVPYLFVRMDYNETIMRAVGPTLQILGFGALLLQSALFPERFRPLNWKIAQQIGILSYSIYIWQMLFCSKPEMFGWRPKWFMSFYGWIPAVLLVATASYYCLERPLLKLRARFRQHPKI
jgi:peptidoglycan/LPS O-acetylase OafA/YrhL